MRTEGKSREETRSEPERLEQALSELRQNKETTLRLIALLWKRLDTLDAKPKQEHSNTPHPCQCGRSMQLQSGM